MVIGKSELEDSENIEIRREFAHDVGTNGSEHPFDLPKRKLSFYFPSAPATLGGEARKLRRACVLFAIGPNEWGRPEINGAATMRRGSLSSLRSGNSRPMESQ